MEEELEEKINFWINGVCTCIVVIIGVILNFFSIYIIWKKYENANIFYQMLISLLCFDSLVLVTCMNLSLSLAFRVNNAVTMHMFPYFSYPLPLIAITASTFMTVAIAHERYLAVKDPLQYSQHMKTPKLQAQRLKLYLFVVIAISVVVNVPHFIELEVRYVDTSLIVNNATDLCHQNKSEVSTGSLANDTMQQVEEIQSANATFQTMFCYTALGENPYYLNYYRNWAKLIITGIVPFVLLIFFNTYIFRAIKKVANRRKRLTSAAPAAPHQPLSTEQPNDRNKTMSIGLGVTPSSRPAHSSTKRKDEENLSMVFVAIVTIFLFCHSLKIALNLYDGITGKVGATRWNRIGGYFSNFLIVLNSAINMVVYCILNRKFRNYFLKAIEGTSPCFQKCAKRSEHTEEAMAPDTKPLKSTRMIEMSTVNDPTEDAIDLQNLPSKSTQTLK